MSERSREMAELDKRMTAGIAIGEKLEAQFGPTSPQMYAWYERFAPLNDRWHQLYDEEHAA